eukprot:tig00000113_g5686.t1
MFVPNKPPKGAGRRPNNFQDAVNEITPDNFPVSKLTEVMAYEANCNYIGVKYSLNRKDPERLQLRIEDAHRELVNLELRPYVVPEDKLEDAMKDARNGKSAFLVHPCSVCGYKRIGNPEHDEIVEKFSRTSKHVFGSKDFCHCEEEDGPVEDVEHVEKTPAPPKRGRRSRPAAEGSRKRARTMNYAVLASGGLDLEAAKEKAQQEKGQQ